MREYLDRASLMAVHHCVGIIMIYALCLRNFKRGCFKRILYYIKDTIPFLEDVRTQTGIK